MAVNGPPNGLPPQSSKQITYLNVVASVHAQPDGSRVLVFMTPTEQVAIPMSQDASETIGRALLAPGVHVPRPGEMPS